MNPSVQILTGDCRLMLATVREKSVHTIVTSPPYWALRDYGVDGQIGLEKTARGFFDAIGQVFTELWRTLRDDGTAWVNMGDTWIDGELQGIPWDMINHIRRNLGFCPKCDTPKPESIMHKDLLKSRCLGCGHIADWKKFRHWRLRSEIIWHKPNPVPEPNRGRPTLAHETIFLLVKSERYFFDNDAIREAAGDEPDWESYIAGLGSNTGCDSHRWTKGYKKVSHELTHPDGRQKRSVWTVPTKGFPGAHFATFPSKLIEPCILAGTSEKGCCASCGAPQKRISEFTQEYREKLGQSWHDHKNDISRGQRGVPASFRGAPTRVTKGWEPTCQCGTDQFVPCTVLDPFGGSGTTGEVALNLGRSAILVELNPEYVKMIEDRTMQLRLGFAG